jgi:hypothetical protein
MLLITYSAHIDAGLVAEKQLIQADVEKAPGSARASMISTNPNQMLSDGIKQREMFCLRVRGWASIFQ